MERVLVKYSFKFWEKLACILESISCKGERQLVEVSGNSKKSLVLDSAGTRLNLVVIIITKWNLEKNWKKARTF